MILCPACNQPCDVSTALIAGETVLRCKPCRKMAVMIEGATVEWLPAGPGITDRLRGIAERTRQHLAILTSDDDDPRWSS